MKDAQNKDGVAVLIAAPAADVKSVRINVTMPADVLDQIDRYAEREGFTRSGFLAQNVFVHLADSHRKKRTEQRREPDATGTGRHGVQLEGDVSLPLIAFVKLMRRITLSCRDT